MIGYIRAKLAWLDAGGKGSEPNFTDYEKRAGAAGRKRAVPQRKPGNATPAITRRAALNGGKASATAGK
jgi:hypothetical protein